MQSSANALAAILALVADPEAAEALSPLGDHGLAVLPVDEAGAVREMVDRLQPGGPILIGVDEAGAVPEGLTDMFDVLLTTAPSPPRPWVEAQGGALGGAVSAVAARVRERPMAASIFASVLRLGESLSFSQALILESLAYSALLGGGDFRQWRAAEPLRSALPPDRDFVRIERRGDVVVITLSRPEARNAIRARLRDDLVAALRFAEADRSISAIELRGDGPVFSAGGDLDEFGQASDLAMAHIVRTQRSPVRLVRALGERLTVFIQGAAIGGGIEIAAAAARVIGGPEAVFRLPEVGMGLLPGAGGTASMPRRIGRHRTAFMGLTGFDIDAVRALDWALVDRVEPIG